MKTIVTVLEYDLIFSRPARTSRNVMNTRKVWYLFVSSPENPAVSGIGECAPLEGLSAEKEADVRNVLQQLCTGSIPVSPLAPELIAFPSVRFAVETALLDLANGGRRILFPEFSQNMSKVIPINGLVWMNDAGKMLQEALQKIDNGYACIKLKIGGLPFEDELFVLNELRKKYHPSLLQIRLDANGAFSPGIVMERLRKLVEFSIHSIEQPVRRGQWETMAEVCAVSPIPVALDEELIGIHHKDEMGRMLELIKPQYIILKPSLHGGFMGMDQWIASADNSGIRWWVTSALESNIGLNAIAQWVSRKGDLIPQGLGTGGLYTNNVQSPWTADAGYLKFTDADNWDLSNVLNKMKG